jgi:hypothetical protein
MAQSTTLRQQLAPPLLPPSPLKEGQGWTHVCPCPRWTCTCSSCCSTQVVRRGGRRGRGVEEKGRYQEVTWSPLIIWGTPQSDSKLQIINRSPTALLWSVGPCPCCHNRQSLLAQQSYSNQDRHPAPAVFTNAEPIPTKSAHAHNQLPQLRMACDSPSTAVVCDHLP